MANDKYKPRFLSTESFDLKSFDLKRTYQGGAVLMRNKKLEKISHFAQCYILTSSCFQKIKTKNFNLDPCCFNLLKLGANPLVIYLVKLINSNVRRSCAICSKLIMKTPELCKWRNSCVFIISFEQISHPVLVVLFLNLSR